MIGRRFRSGAVIASLHWLQERIAKRYVIRPWLGFSALAIISAALATLVMADLPDGETAVDTPEAMSWPMLPGESVKQLARLFYPKNQAMQKRFIDKTLELSHEINPTLSADAVFTEPATLMVPDLKALSKSSKAFKSQSRHKGKFPPLHLSYKIKDADQFKVSPEMRADFDDLTKRNITLKEELKKLNEKLISLQQILSDMLTQASKSISGSSPTSVADANKPKKIAKADERRPVAPASPVAATPPVAVAPVAAPVTPAPVKVEPTKPVEAKPAEIKPAELKPAPIKSAETKSVEPAVPVTPIASAKTEEKPLAPAPAEKFDSVVQPNTPVQPNKPVQPQLPDEPRTVPSPAKAIKQQEQEISMLDSSIVGIAIQLGIILIGLVMAFFAWRWARKGIARQIRKITNAQMDAMHKNEFDPNNPGAFHPSKPGAVDNPDLSMLMIEEFESIVEEARIFMSMDRPAEAISMLQHHIEEQPKSSLHPWIYLLDIYLEQDMREEFIELGKRFHETFNVIAPIWHADTQAGMVLAESLEEFPHIITQLQNLWETAEAKTYLENLISDNRGGERGGFSFEVIKEIMMLLGVLELRDRKLTL